VQMKNWEPLLWVVSSAHGGVVEDHLRSGAGVGHGEDTGASVLEVEVLVLELLAVDGLSTRTLLSISLLSPSM